MTSAFDNSGEAVIERTIGSNSKYSSYNLELNFELESCVKWILDGQFKKVGLQFPDELLTAAPAVARALTSKLGFHVYILGDTTYGSCCVDEVAAEHVGADSVIHYGRACLSPSRRLPVLYIFTQIAVDEDAVIEGLCRTIDDLNTNLIFTYDAQCFYIADKVANRLREKFPRLIISELIIPSYERKVNKSFINDSSLEDGKNCNGENGSIDNASSVSEKEGYFAFNGRKVKLPENTTLQEYQFIYMGPESLTLTCLSMRFSQQVFYHVNPVDGKVQSITGVKSVMNRSAKLELAKDSEIIGILVGTLGVADYRNIINRIKTIIKSVGKKSYTFVVGKPNEPKLANIPEVDVFVYVSCPETSIVERQTDPALYRKLITPWELEVALLGDQEWSLNFETDFRQLLLGGSRHVEMSEKYKTEETANVSLLTNKTQMLGLRNDTDMDARLSNASGTMVLADGSNMSLIHVGGGGEALKGKSWQGLDPSLPAPVNLGTVVEGFKGIAAGYDRET
ncbi:unnamed protein product, partial [Meganyctiphanes norvegica]